LLLLDLLVHEISCEEKYDLGIKSFLPDFFHDTTKLIHFYLLFVAIDSCNRFLDTSILKYNSSCFYIKEDIFLG
jgi:hypothetical protein